ncbi:hypothetical protein [Lacisediminihabitans sp.]|uniref:hypothetical protein n=1 Tax=Lacisediminihabitans sp. TaxID=2787631 RepID=UPI002F925508
MSAASTTAGVSRFELTLDELSLLREHIPGLVLPSFIQSNAVPDEGAAFAAMRKRELVGEATIASEVDWTATIAPAVKLALALQMSGDFIFQVTAWTDTEVTAHSSTVTGGVASGLTAASARQNAQAPLAPAGIVLTLAPVAVLSKSLAELLPSTAGAPVAPSSGPLTVGLVESRALVAAIRAGDPRVIDAVAADIHAADAQTVFSQLAGPITAGFRVKVFTLSGGCVYSGDWFLGANGWLKISVAASPAPNASVTAQSVTDGGSVTISAVTAKSIEVELLSLVSEGVRDNYVERQA